MSLETEIQAMVDRETEAWNRQDAALVFHTGHLDYTERPEGER